MSWTSRQGIVLRDRVPARVRRRWIARGHCTDRDLYTLYAAHERSHPDRPAVVTPAGAVGFAELGDAARRLAGTLHEAGHGRHDIIGIQVPNGVPAVVAELAVAALGAVALPVPSGRGRRDTLSLLGRSRAGAVITADPATLRGLDLPDLRTILSPDAGVAPRPEPRGAAHDLLGPGGTVPGGVGRDRLGPGGFGHSGTPPGGLDMVDPEAPARILVSSGSEAEPKMVAYSHNAMAGGRGNYAAALYGDVSPVRALMLMPLSSSYGSLGIVTLVRHGGTLVLLDGFDAVAALRAVTEYRPTHLFGVPTMLRRMADLPVADGEDLTCLRTVVSSSAMLAPAALESCRGRFGCPVVNVYGSSDGVNCHTARGGAGVGRPDPAVAEIRIGADGEILARGPMTPLCYVNAPELDARYRASGGWVRTGDRGCLDERGDLHVVDRIRQIVIRGGFTISPAEVERQIGAHPAVSDVACVPVPDADLGERLCACIVARPGARPPGLAELTGFLEDQCGLERRKLPELLLVLPDLPLGPTGKVCRQTLTGHAARHLTGKP